MAIYNLLTGVTATQTAPPSSVRPWGPMNSTSPPDKQTFHLVVSGSAGNQSATVQIVASNDDAQPDSAKNWVPYGDPIAAPSTYLTAQASAVMTGNFKHYGAYVTAISGTNAAVSLKMSA